MLFVHCVCACMCTRAYTEAKCWHWAFSLIALHLIFEGLSLILLTWLSTKPQEPSCPCLPALGLQAHAVTLAAGDDLGPHTCTANTVVPDPSLSSKENICFSKAFFSQIVLGILSQGFENAGLTLYSWATPQPKAVFHLFIILFEMGHTEYNFTVWHKSTVCLRFFTLVANISRLPYKLNTMYPRLASIALSLLPEDQTICMCHCVHHNRTGH